MKILLVYIETRNTPQRNIASCLNLLRTSTNIEIYVDVCDGRLINILGVRDAPITALDDILRLHLFVQCIYGDKVVTTLRRTSEILIELSNCKMIVCTMYTSIYT